MKRSFLFLLILGLVVMVAGCGGGQAGPTGPTDEERVNNFLDTFAEAYKAKDAAAIASLCSFPFTFQGTSVDSEYHFNPILQAWFDTTEEIEVFELLDRVIVVNGDTVNVTCTQRLVTGGVEETANVVITGAKTGNEWKGQSYSSL